MADDLRTEAELKAKIAQLTSLIAQAENERRVASGEATQESIRSSQASLRSIEDQARALGTLRNESGRAAAATDELNRATREYSRSASSSTDNVTTNLIKAQDAIIKTSKETEEALERMTETRRRSVQDIVDVVGGSSQLLIESTNDAKTAVDFVASQAMGASDKVRSYHRSINDLQTAQIAESSANAIARVNSTNSVLINSQAYLTELNRQMLVNDKENAINGIEIYQMYGADIGKMFQNQFGAILKDPTLRRVFAFDFLDPDAASKNISEYSKEIELLMRGLGATSEDMKTFIEYNLNSTGKASVDYASEVGKSSLAASQAFGLNAKDILRDITLMTNQAAVFGFRTAEEFGAIAATAAEARMSISEMQGVINKFDSLETATSIVADLNTVLGTNFDAVELMVKRYNDLPGFFETLSTGIKSTGLTFDELSKQPVRFAAVLKQVGGDVTALRALFDGDFSNFKERMSMQKAEVDKSSADYKASLALLATPPDAKPDEQFANQLKRLQEIQNIGLERVKESQRANNDLIVLIKEVGEKFGPEMEKYTKILYEYNRNMQIFGRVTSAAILEQETPKLSQYVDTLAQQIIGAQEQYRDDLIKLIETQTSASDAQVAALRDLVTQVGQVGTPNQPQTIVTPSPAPSPQPPTATPASQPAQPTATPTTPATTSQPTSAPTTTPTAPTPAAGSLDGRLAVSPNGTEATLSFSIGPIVEAVMQYQMRNPNLFGSVGN